MQVYERHVTLPFLAEDVFAHCVRAGTYERLMPPWQRSRLREHSGVREGGRVVLDKGSALLTRRWVAQFSGVEPGRAFTERQTHGPFGAWQHTRRFLPRGEESCELIDHVEFQLAWFGALAGSRQLERLFRFRHARIRNDMDHHAVWASQPRLTVVVAGAQGLIGSHLISYLASAGHEVRRLVRRACADPSEIRWDPEGGRLDPAALCGADAVVNLSGVSLATLWTSGKREELLQSRLRATQTLAGAIRRMEAPPAVLLSASAVGAYGSRGGEELTEESPRGTGFLADLCERWEAAAEPAASAGVRVVTPRFGIVVSGIGGAIGALLPVFRAGLGGTVGGGRQWWSWVAIDDVLGALQWMLHDVTMHGVVNVVAPQAVTNREFARTVAGVLRRPAVLRLPHPVANHLGGMPREMLLASQRVVPKRLREAGYRFALPEFEQALRFEMGRQ